MRFEIDIRPHQVRRNVSGKAAERLIEIGERLGKLRELRIQPPPVEVIEIIVGIQGDRLS